ncbi:MULTISPECIES: tRNA (adenosine(37)-N6)-dimethylallyltransferase MiaA [Helicobacter]|uniref:tRNA (adenosine(37)-N6)-dimethylallyltransferase MiaA n=1 Tax=Helicobacter TaxID=209 RepID=UPI000EB08291|nr:MULTISPECIES: tRNA (adenosine(37)-N6)-dimethylallyltransferase MiaA [Helicobacter]
MPLLIAILGASASGKSALALELACELGAEVLCLDSLSVYKDFNIASAKPSPQDLARVKHYAINVLEIWQACHAPLFLQELQRALAQSRAPVLLLVGGSGFYLKAILEGLSPQPPISPSVRAQVANFPKPYETLQSLDPLYAQQIHPKDTYRVQRALEIFLATNTPPSLYFKAHPKIPFKLPIKLYALCLPKDILHTRIATRTKRMLDQGLIAEVQGLAHKYGNTHQPFKAIGPKECLAYLNGQYNAKQLQQAITIHTQQLAKRQNTFNKTQFKDITHLEAPALYKEILEYIRSHT